MSDTLKVIPTEDTVKTGVRDKEGIAVGTSRSIDEVLDAGKKKKYQIFYTV